MSYILNALRKSERERQACQPDTVAGRIVLQHAPPQHATAKIIAALLAVNAAILAYFLGVAPRMAANGNAPPQAAAQQLPALPPAESNPAPPGERPPLPAKASPKAKPEQTRAATPAAAVKSAELKKPPIEPAEPASAAKPLPAAEPAGRPPMRAAIANVEAGAATPGPVALAAKSGLPTLEQLPAELRQSLPSLPINVFSYSPIPAERFVMIDMVKYVPGQMIKDRLELKQILEDGIVVSYDGQQFKIKRQ
ncbi:general secretion pathway protein GspB [Methylomonas koyamae]|uniref:general secretion pathway protein GspB n=1 Tax=Methylomonas koyamae TaxID=702114 RepID=UPI0028739781|nr:general secretion pathway protein GspB [Methylomonas koyamae]WNB75424.1 general secretion pathway protein GspB [Methylomonas koyamae]